MSSSNYPNRNVSFEPIPEETYTDLLPYEMMLAEMARCRFAGRPGERDPEVKRIRDGIAAARENDENLRGMKWWDEYDCDQEDKRAARKLEPSSRLIDRTIPMRDLVVSDLAKDKELFFGRDQSDPIPSPSALALKAMYGPKEEPEK